MPLFKEKASELVDFVSGARLVGHNAPFDLTFLNAELGRCALPPFIGALDTLELARAKLPGRQHSLDALCDHFGVSRRSREKHGALRDAKLLAEVYLRLSRRRQAQLVRFSAAPGRWGRGGTAPMVRPFPLPSRLSAEELETHRRLVAGLGAKALWNRYLA